MDTLELPQGRLENLWNRLRMDHLEAQLMQSASRRPPSKWITRISLFRLQTEYQGRFQRGIEARLRQARFPWIKTLDQFDFDFQPSLDRKQVRELAGMSFVERSHNVILLWPPGVGKTHLAVALG